MPCHIAPGTGNRTLCGIEVNGVDWAAADFSVPRPNEQVSCEDCLRQFQAMPVAQAVAEMGVSSMDPMGEPSMTEALDRWGAEGSEDGSEMEAMSDGPSEDRGPQTPGRGGVSLQVEIPPELRETLAQLQEVTRDIVERDRIDFEALHRENEELRKANEELRDQISILTLAAAHLMAKREHPRAELSAKAKEWGRVIQEALRQGVRVHPVIKPLGKGEWQFDIESEQPLDEPPSSVWERLGEDD